jgi:putative SOS response-associated peptidase YedK
MAVGEEEIVDFFDLTTSTANHNIPLNWNIAPTNPIYIIREENFRDEKNSDVLDVASWGMIAPWQKNMLDARASQSHAINARSESIFEKPTFRDAFRRTRCLIPASGYYEWATALGQYPPKQPFYISHKSDPLLSIAGIWSSWTSEKGEVITTASIITQEAVGDLATIHSRMPVFMPRDRWSAWLDSDTRDIDELRALMVVTNPADIVKAAPVSSRVNVVANNGPELILPIELGEPTTLF